MKETKWTSEIPKQAGLYWCYGWLWDKTTGFGDKERIKEKELTTIKVAKASNSFIYLYKECHYIQTVDLIECQFLPVEIPELPK